MTQFRCIYRGGGWNAVSGGDLILKAFTALISSMIHGASKQLNYSHPKSLHVIITKKMLASGRRALVQTERSGLMCAPNVLHPNQKVAGKGCKGWPALPAGLSIIGGGSVLSLSAELLTPELRCRFAQIEALCCPPPNHLWQKDSLNQLR